MDEGGGGTRRSRIEALKALGAGVVGVAAGSLLGSKEARAADGQPLTIGQVNTGTLKTELDASGSGNAFLVSAPNGFAVAGTGRTGGFFSGSGAAINLDPRATTSPPSGAALKGDLAVTSDGVLWLCASAGPPAIWIKVSHGGVRFLDSPVRAYDSRQTSSGKLRSGEDRAINITPAVAGVPTNALGVVGNLTVTETEGGGFVTAYPEGTPRPITSNINWSSPNFTVANSMTIRLGSSSGSIALYAEATSPNATHIVVDVAGYIL